MTKSSADVAGKLSGSYEALFFHRDCTACSTTLSCEVKAVNVWRAQKTMECCDKLTSFLINWGSLVWSPGWEKAPSLFWMKLDRFRDHLWNTRFLQSISCNATTYIGQTSPWPHGITWGMGYTLPLWEGAFSFSPRSFIDSSSTGTGTCWLTKLTCQILQSWLQNVSM